MSVESVSSPNQFFSGPPLSPRERLHRSRRGEIVDRPPMSFWRHFPQYDPYPDQLAKATIEFQEKYKLDLVKLMPSGMYSVTDYGVITGEPDPVTGARARVGGAIKTMADVLRIASQKFANNSVMAEVQVATEVRQTINCDTPVIETIFSPLTMLAKLSPAPLEFTLFELGQRCGPVLEKFADDVVEFASSCLDAGVDGFFYATQWASTSLLDDSLYHEFGLTYDSKIVSALRPRSKLLMLHLHGSLPRMELAQELPVDWVNWEDRDSVPSMATASQTLPVGLAGGLPRSAAQYGNSAQACCRYIDDAVYETTGSRLLLAPGCVLGQDVSSLVLRSLRECVEGYVTSKGR